MALSVSSFAVPIAADDTPSRLEQSAKHLEESLIAPCCWNQTVATHQSPVASEVRDDIRRRLTAGEEPESILRSYVEQHGPKVLSRPPAKGFQRLLYVLMPLVLVLVGAATAMALGIRKRAFEREPAPRSIRDEAELRTKLERELDDLAT